MDVHLVDGTYELFRHFFAVPRRTNARGEEIGAVRGVVASLLGMLDDGVTHLGVATDHIIESFRNDLYPRYKTADGVPQELLAQFPLLEETLSAFGIVVWPMTDLEADDALASAAADAAADERVGRVLICTPDKDLAQCVSGTRVVQFDRRKRELRDEDGVVRRFGVLPESIPDYLALVGDSSDGFPGLPGWGPRSAATVLARFGHLEDIPRLGHRWPDVRGARKLAAVLDERRTEAFLYRKLATLVRDAHPFDDIEEVRWTGPADDLAGASERIDAPDLRERVRALASRVRERE